jgi:hypothetical protein
MCITHFNIHTCGHICYVDVDICHAHLKAVEMYAYTEEEVPNNGIKVDTNILMTLLSEYRRRCADQTEERGRRRNYRCGPCLKEILKSTGLTDDEDVGGDGLVSRMEFESLDGDEVADGDELVTAMEPGASEYER